jgi:hypothetical protein
MSNGVYVVYSEPVSPEREAEYNNWYDKVHLGQVCEVPGIKAATRYRLNGDGGPVSLPPYLAIYEIDSDDPAECVNEIMRRVGTGVIEMSGALRTDPPPSTALYIAD